MVANTNGGIILFTAIVAHTPVKTTNSWVWWHTPLITNDGGKGRQNSQVPGQLEVYSETLSQKRKIKIHPCSFKQGYLNSVGHKEGDLLGRNASEGKEMRVMGGGVKRT